MLSALHVYFMQQTFRQWLSSLFTPTPEGQKAAQNVLSSKYIIILLYIIVV